MANCSAEEYYHQATEDCRNCREVCGPTKIFEECVLRCSEYLNLTTRATELSSTEPSTTEYYYHWIFVASAIAFVILVIFLLIVGIWICKRRKYNRKSSLTKRPSITCIPIQATDKEGIDVEQDSKTELMFA